MLEHIDFTRKVGQSKIPDISTVKLIAKRGLRSDYSSRQDNLFASRGKLLMAPHLRQNLYRADRRADVGPPDP